MVVIVIFTGASTCMSIVVVEIHQRNKVYYQNKFSTFSYCVIGKITVTITLAPVIAPPYYSRRHIAYRILSPILSIIQIERNEMKRRQQEDNKIRKRKGWYTKTNSVSTKANVRGFEFKSIT